MRAHDAKLVPLFVTSAKISGPKRSIKINKHFTCMSANVIFCITCTPYKRYHIGETERRLGDRFREHLRDVKAMTKPHSNINSNTKFPSIPWFHFVHIKHTQRTCSPYALAKG